MYAEIVYYVEYKCNIGMHAREIAANADNERQ